jgi:cell division septal protein FtsQ
MKRTKRSRLARNITLFIIAGLLVFIACKIFRTYLLTSSFFKIKTVITTGALKPLLAEDQFRLKGKNLFSTDIKHLARGLKLSYPYLADIRVSRIMPDKIWFDAQERTAVARVKLADKIFLCDANAVILPVATSKASLILIAGVDAQASRVRMGEVYDSVQLKTAIALLRAIRAARELQALTLVRIDVSNPERMSFLLNNGVEVIIGNELMPQRLKVLAVVLMNLKSEVDKVKYIDLRFKEPAIGKL